MLLFYGLIELEVVASIVVRDILYHTREALHVVRKQALLYIIAEEVAEQTTEVLVTWKNQEVIDERTLFRVHQAISTGLVSGEESGYLRTRGVRISGTAYIPPKNLNDIRAKLNEILYQQEQYTNPLERAVYLHCNIAKLQPFIDGNKRTSRMVESIALMNADIIPVYSSKDADILNYRKGLIAFYETGDYSFYAGYFLDKQVERIKGIE